MIVLLFYPEYHMFCFRVMGPNLADFT